MLETLAIRRLILTAAALGAAAIPALAPVAPAAATVIRVTPAVREIVRSLSRVEIPAAWRRRNWTGTRGQGSCVHASMVHLLHWQGRHELADWWQRRYSDGEDANGLASKLEAAGVRFAETQTGEVKFLEWALRTRRGANVVVQNGAHMVTLAGLDAKTATILDSNDPDRLRAIPGLLFSPTGKEAAAGR